MELRIGSLLSSLRYEKKRTLYDVSRGLCTEKSLSRFELDERFPDKLLTDRLFGRLGKKTEKYEMIINDEDFYTVSYWEKLDDMLLCGKYGEIKTKLQEYAVPRKSANLHRQRMRKMQADICRRQGDDETALKLYREALLYTKIDVWQDISKIKCVDYTELEMLYCTAVLMEKTVGHAGRENDGKMTALKRRAGHIFKYIEEHMEEMMQEDGKTTEICIGILYRTACECAREGRDQEAWEMVNKGIALEKKTRKISLLGDLLLLKCEIGERLGVMDREALFAEYKNLYACLWLGNAHLHQPGSGEKLARVAGKLKEEYKWDFIK